MYHLLTKVKRIVAPGFIREDPMQPATWMPPGHFYSPIPSIEDIRAREAQVFPPPPRAIPAVDLDDAGQVALLRELGSYYPELSFPRTRTPGHRYYFENPYYSYADAIVLYCMIRHLRPARIIEVGSGYSSCAILDTNDRFFGSSIGCTFIEPYPQVLYDLLEPGDVAGLRVLERKLQDVPLDVFRELKANDILFVDSTHVSKTGSDVNRLLFEVLPALRAGVYVHFHDVFYPFEYPREWVYEGRAWNENYILRAFLEYNSAFRIALFMSYLVHFRAKLLDEIMPLYVENPGGNLWLRKCDPS